VHELYTLATTLNMMLDQVQHTLEIEQQTAVALCRFVADAAYELRSPLAVLRGSAEGPPAADSAARDEPLKRPPDKRASYQEGFRHCWEGFSPSRPLE
jgi:signal transduction histidine kinase